MSLVSYDSSSEDEKCEDKLDAKHQTQPSDPASHTDEPQPPPPKKPRLSLPSVDDVFEKVPASRFLQSRAAVTPEQQVVKPNPEKKEPSALPALPSEKSVDLEAIRKASDLQAKRKLEKLRNKPKTFNEKEKRKRDLGQCSRAKNFVEEEKRVLRNEGSFS